MMGLFMGIVFNWAAMELIGITGGAPAVSESTAPEGEPIAALLDGAGCRFPSSWSGEWFLSGAGGTISINRTSILGKGECHQHKSGKTNDYYLLFDRLQNCQQCITVEKKLQNRNVLQFKEGYCLPVDEETSMSKLCEGLNHPQLPLFSMFRVQAKPEKCPFTGRFSFTYSQSYRHCRSPVSYAESCIRDSEMMLYYKSCPDITEERKVKLECFGTWRHQDNHEYLLGRIFHHMASSHEETFRCFLYKKTTDGVLLAQSADATCNSLFSATDGPQTLVMTKLNEADPQCVFPTWLTKQRELQDMASTIRYEFGVNRNFFTLHNNNSSNNGEPIMRAACHHMVSAEDHNHSQVFRAVAAVTRGCSSGFICYSWKRRSDHIIQVQQGRFSKFEDTACSEDFLSNTSEWTTLLTTSGATVACPFPGDYLVSTPQSFAVGLSGAFGCSQITKVSIGCHRETHVALQSYPSSDLECRYTIEDASPMHFTCHGHWMEDQVAYFVATDSKSTRKHCFSYQTTDGTIQLSSTPGKCPSNLADAEQFNVLTYSECVVSSSIRNDINLRWIIWNLLLFYTVYLSTNHRLLPLC